MKPNMLASVLFSVIAVVLICVHVVNSGQVDVLDLGLLVVAFIPWFWTIFKSVKVPGVAEIEFRELEKTVERQDDEIRALRFVVANFLTQRQLEILRALAEPGPADNIPDDDDNLRRFEVLGQLIALGFVQPTGDWNQFATINWRGDLKDLFAITTLGREYLDVRASADMSV